jgi:hypothetical protein
VTGKLIGTISERAEGAVESKLGGASEGLSMALRHLVGVSEADAVRQWWSALTMAHRRELSRLLIAEVRVGQGRPGSRFDPDARLTYLWHE